MIKMSLNCFKTLKKGCIKISKNFKSGQWVIVISGEHLLGQVGRIMNTDENKIDVEFIGGHWVFDESELELRM